jgi:hypothetical protein
VHRWRTLFIYVQTLLFAAVALAVLPLAFLPHTASFTADAHTESLLIRIRADDAAPLLGRPSVILQAGEPVTAACQDPAFHFLPQRAKAFDARIALARRPPSDAVAPAAPPAPDIAMVIDDAPAPVAALDCPDGRSRALSSPLTLIFRSQEPRDGLTMHLRGVVTLGASPHDVPANVAPGRQPLLLDGELVSEVSSWPIPSSRTHSTTPLHMGDQVSFGAVDPDQGQPAEVLVRTLDGPATGPVLHVIAHAEAQKALVSVSGLQETGTVLAYAPNFWNRLKAMDVWGALALLIGAAVGLAQAWLAHLEHLAGRSARTPFHPPP